MRITRVRGEVGMRWGMRIKRVVGEGAHRALTISTPPKGEEGVQGPENDVGLH